MSIWTHINGSIRLDGLDILGSKADKLEDFIGKTCSFGDDEPVWDACSVPTGSEGSLQYRVIDYGHENSLASKSVLIWGDLRDYEFEKWQEIRDWFTKITSKELAKNTGYWVRQGVLQLEEGDHTEVIAAPKEDL